MLAVDRGDPRLHHHVGEPSGQLFEQDADLEPGQIDAHADMGADAEGEVGVGAAIEPERVRLVEHVFVTIGRLVEHQHLLALGDPVAGQLGVGGRRP